MCKSPNARLGYGATLIFGCLLLLMVPTGSVAAEPIAAEHLFPQRLVRTVSLSPDGTRAAYIRQHGRGSTVRVHDIESDSSKPRLTSRAADVSLVQWANTEKLLIGHRAWNFVKRGRRIGFAPIMRIQVTTDTQQVEVFSDEDFLFADIPYFSPIAEIAPWDPDHIYIPTVTKRKRVTLTKVNLNTLERTIIAEGNRETYRWIVGRDGSVRTRIDLIYGQTFFAFYEPDPETGKWIKIREEVRDLTNDSDKFWPVSPTDNAEEYYTLTRGGDEEFSTIRRYNRNTKAFSKPVVAVPDADIIHAVTSETDGRLVGGGFWKDRYGLQMLDRDQQAHIIGLHEFFEDDANIFVENIAIREDGGATGLLFVSSPTIAGEYYLYDFAKGSIKAFFGAYPALVERDFGETDIVSYDARDGLKITGYLTHPVGVGADEPAPLIMMPHGGPAARDYYIFDPLVQFLATRGYRVFKPNFRGSKGLGRSFENAGHGEWGAAMQDDVVDGILWLQAQGLATPETTCIVGASYGGYVALRAATETPELISCAVSVSGISDLNKILKSDRQVFGRRSSEYRYLVESIGDPKEQKKILQDRSPINAIDKIEDPILLVHGELDGRVPVEQSQRFYRLVQKAGHQVEYLEFEGIGHSDWPSPNMIAYAKRLENFLQESLAP